MITHQQIWDLFQRAGRLILSGAQPPSSIRPRFSVYVDYCALLLLLFSVVACQSAIPAPPTPPLPATPAGPTLRVALLSPMSGEMATFGRQMRNGIIMAFDGWNKRGGPRAHRLTWQLYDSQCDFDRAEQVTQQAIEEGHHLIIGPLCSEAAIAAALVAEANSALLITPTATHPLVTVTGQGQTRPTVFRASYAYPQQAAAVAHFAATDLAVENVALLYDPGDAYSTALARTFEQTFTAQDGRIAYRTTLTPETPDLVPILTALRTAGSQVVYAPLDPELAARLNEAAAPSEPLILLGSDRWATTHFDQSGLVGSYYPLHFTPNDDRPQIVRWAEAYKAIYAVEPDSLAALGYEAADLLAQAVDTGGSIDPATVAHTLAQNTFETFTGPLRFDDHHNPIKPIPILEVEAEGTDFVTVVTP